ncbi:hypothetical protein ATKI12_8834 [Kitasatospora sp. Ki12]
MVPVWNTRNVDDWPLDTASCTAGSVYVVAPAGSVSWP